MDDEGAFERFLRLKLRAAGRQYAEAKRAYSQARRESAPDGSASDGPEAVDVPSLPEDEEGHARIVCRRHAEKRATAVDDAGRPSCFDADHVDCRGCVEDVRDGTVETW